LANADEKTTAKGINRNTPRKTTVTPISDQRTSIRSDVARPALRAAALPSLGNGKVVAMSSSFSS
jgi:hypothetical protein